MVKNFWEKIKKPIIALAPLAGVTDSPFRLICKEFGAQVVYSEMISATALFYCSKETLTLAKFSKKERPYVVQLFGSDPKHFAVAAKIITQKIKPDGIDINFGCPAKKVLRQKSGAALMANLDLSRAVIEAVLENTDLPVSIKVRTASGKVELIDFLKKIKDLPLAALMIHGRTLNQGFSGEVDYKAIIAARKYFTGKILANGGINSSADILKVLNKTKADGVGIGRGALGNPWIFSKVNKKELGFKKIFKVALKQTKLMFKAKGVAGILEMRKHLCWYVSDLPGARRLREELVKVKTIKDVENIFKNHKTLL